MPDSRRNSPRAPGRAAAHGQGVDARRSELGRQAFRFVVAGGAVAVLYVAVTTALTVNGVPFQAALVLGFATALAAHFALQRLFVWIHADGYALPLGRQAARYLPVAGAQYGVTSLATLVLPAALGVGVLVVYLPTAVVLAAVSFVVLRMHVFHPAGPPMDV